MCRALGRQGHWPKALDYYALMKQEGLSPTLMTYNSLLHALAKGGQWEKAEMLVKDIAKVSLKPDALTYNLLMSAFGEAEQWEKGLQLYETMQEAGVRGDLVLSLWFAGVSFGITPPPPHLCPRCGLS